MASKAYDAVTTALMTAGVDLAGGTIKAVLVKSTYTFSAAHANLSDVPSGQRAGSAVALTTKTVSAGVFDADDTTFTSIPSGSTVIGAVVFKDTGVEATSTLIAYEEFASSVLTNGGDITAQWDSGTNKILKLTAV